LYYSLNIIAKIKKIKNFTSRFKFFLKAFGRKAKPDSKKTLGKW
jgi:hypothetical protein